MARKLRVFIEETAQHVKLRSIDNTNLFKDESDYISFINILENLNVNISIHAYVLMPTYFEFVATPLEENTLSKFMQNLGRQYVWYFNKKYNRTGTLWDGRYKSSLVEDSLYIFEVMRYIELLPVNENIVLNIEDYKFSSVHKNLFNKKNNIITYHTKYKELGFTQEQRIKKYSNIFYSLLDDKNRSFINECLEKQLVTGSVSFIKKIEKIIGFTLSEKRRGRPKKEIKRKKMFKNLVVLDKEKHSNLKINPVEDLFFAKDNIFVPLSAVEVPKVGESFPVVFIDDKNPALVALVSLGDSNLAVNPEGKWISNYIPLNIRKYPYSLVSAKDNPDQKIVLIDEESKLFSKSKGKQLFKKNGEQSESLEKAIQFLSIQDKEVTITKSIIKEIIDSGILEEREISVGEGDEKKILVSGFKVVSTEKLNALSDDILAKWVRTGVITLIDAHLKSLNNIEGLFTLAQQRQS